ncbi:MULTISPECIES: type II toxin-antitoxin system HicB family antitoxin [Dickeya]|uniref:type II toxin-antitoxin system HicB family antitoxin n=1 Tax=Dickeya TaxID=204037 RepID=UPI000532F820|nr:MULTISPECIES: type II toxin-antitoxin system HicB family antitoxin [Dickeya]MCA7005788.1 type II toxin-antitoxin system HicB family antitoxin [Dickeya chrysanthemi]TYL42155.1 type II toxin-antitoxin system HicB family antitoxin [Dickeya sp. ws52]
MSKSSAPNTIEIAGQPAVISYVPELGAFRGKFLGLTGYCDFVSDSIQGLKKEGEISLREYLDDCNASGIEPYARQERIKTFTLRYPESFGERLNQAAAEHEISVNSFIIEALNERMKHV